MELPAQAQHTSYGLAASGAGGDGAQMSNEVIISIPASSAYLSILRTATAGLAALLRFTLDEIEDLRIAVDEACAVLLASHPAAATTQVGQTLGPATNLTCQFTLTSEQITVEVSLPSSADSVRPAPSRNSFAWQVLTALTDNVDTFTRHDELVIQLVKGRTTP